MAMVGGISSAIWYLRKEAAGNKVEATPNQAGSASAFMGGRSRFFTEVHEAVVESTGWDGRGYDVPESEYPTPNTDHVASAEYEITLAREFKFLSKFFLGEKFMLGLASAERFSSVYQGGNMWSSVDCFISAARDVLGLRLPCYEKYGSWEKCTKLGGFRWMSEEFCVVSDFPEVLAVDEDNRPHNETGPSHRWSDGWEFYHWHGVRVPKHVIMDPIKITVEEIEAEQNEEVRRVMIERMGWLEYLQKSKAIRLDRRYNERDGQWEELYQVGDINRFVVSDPSTGRKYALGVVADTTTCDVAQDWLSCGLNKRVIHSS